MKRMDDIIQNVWRPVLSYRVVVASHERSKCDKKIIFIYFKVKGHKRPDAPGLQLFMMLIKRMVTFKFFYAFNS